jgi:hypothetical protein
MTFSIQAFRSTVSQYGGVARTNLFQCRIPAPPNVIKGDGDGMPLQDLPLWCQSVSIPGVTISTAPIQPQGYGRAEQRVTGITLDNFTAVFIMDAEYRIQKFFNKWMRSTVRNATV